MCYVQSIVAESGTRGVYSHTTSFGIRSAPGLVIDGYNNMMIITGRPYGSVWSIATCLAGTYKPTGYSSAICTACSAGTYSLDGAQVCASISCGANEYPTTTSPICYGCPDNSTSPAGSLSSQSCNCVAGYVIVFNTHPSISVGLHPVLCYTDFASYGIVIKVVIHHHVRNVELVIIAIPLWLMKRLLNVRHVILVPINQIWVQ